MIEPIPVAVGRWYFDALRAALATAAVLTAAHTLHDRAIDALALVSIVMLVTYVFASFFVMTSGFAARANARRERVRVLWIYRALALAVALVVAAAAFAIARGLGSMVGAMIAR